MTFRILLAVCLTGLSLAAHAAFDIDDLMKNLAQQKGGKARFVETRTVALLDKPVQSSGEMSFTPPSRLEKRTLSPRPDTVILDGDYVSFERMDGRRMTLNVASRPEAQAFVESVRSTLAGDRAALERHFRLALSGTPAEWSLQLTPLAPAVTALLQRITVQGKGQQVRRIEYLLADGDRSELSIEPITGP